MSNSSALTKALRRGRPKKHGGYTFLSRKELDKEHLHILRYLNGVSAGLIGDLSGGEGEEGLSTAELVLIDRCISLLGCIRCIEEHCKERGVFNNGELQPALGKHYISYTNSLKQILGLLGLERKETEAISPLEFIKRYDEQKNAQEKS